MSAPHSSSIPTNRLPVTQRDLLEIGNVSNDSITQPRNSFTANRVYISDIHNALWRATDRYNVTATFKSMSDDSVLPGSVPNLHYLFDGSYESSITITPDRYLEVSIGFRDEPLGYLGGLPYGDLLVSFYYQGKTTDVQVLAYSDVPTPGWRSVTGPRMAGGGIPGSSFEGGTLAFATRVYMPQEFKFIIKPSGGKDAQIAAIEFAPNRDPKTLYPVVSKYEAETLYERLSWVLNKSVTAYIDKDGSAKFGTITSPSLDAKQDKPTSGTASSSTYLRGDGTWATPTNTTYQLPSQAAIEAGTEATARSISAALLKGAVQRWATGSFSTAISAIGQALNRAATAADARTAIGAAASSHSHTGTEVNVVDPNTDFASRYPVDTFVQEMIGEFGTVWTALDGKEKEPWQGTQAQYDALGTYEADRTYYITD